MKQLALGMVVAGSLIACGGGSGGGVVGGDAGGTIVGVGGGTAPSSSNVVVLWTSDIGQGDFLYKWGEGTADADSWGVDVDTPVPDEATFGGLIGVGLAAMVPSSTTLPDGVVDGTTLESSVLGFAGNFAIIFRPNSNPSQVDWVNDFPVGLSCGVCVPQTDGFDTFTPVSCDALELEVGPLESLTICNWT